MGWGAHRRHLANTIEPSTCVGDAACCQITLISCYQLLLHSGDCGDARGANERTGAGRDVSAC